MADDELRWQDEILQVLYWFRGEGLGVEVARHELSRFLTLEPASLELALERLLAVGLLETRKSGETALYRLTKRGIDEGARRFREEFTPFLGKESHLRCDDPDCECHAAEWDGMCRTLGAGSG